MTKPSVGGKPHCSEQLTQRYQDMPCDYGWTVSHDFDGTMLPKYSVDGKRLYVGNYVRNNYVSGPIVFYPEACCFRVKIEYCRYVKDCHSIAFFYPTPLGREEQTKWEVYDPNKDQDLNTWLDTWKPIKNNQAVEEEN